MKTNSINIHSQEYMETMARLMSQAMESPEGMRALAEEIKGRYASRIVIFDLPPVLRNDDALVFTPFADATLMVVEDGANTREEIERSSERYDVAGDPMTGIKWTKRTTKKIAHELNKLGIVVSRVTVARLLKEMGFSLRVNQKKINRASSVDRNTQFEYIASLREVDWTSLAINFVMVFSPGLLDSRHRVATADNCNSTLG